MNALSPTRIFETLRAYQETAALKAAIDLSIFTAIAGGAGTAAEIAAQCDSSERGIRILCDSLTASSFLEKTEGRYSNTAESQLFLNRKSPAYMGGIAEFLYAPEVLENTMRRLPEAVRKGGTTMDGEGSVSPDNPMWVTFARAMAPITMLPARAMAAQLPATGPLRVLDIAAGHGNFGITIALRNVDAEITGLDWPAVLEVAKENAAKAGVMDRYRTIEGDFFTSDLGSDYDAILIPNFLHHFDKKTCETIMRKVYAALRPGGVAMTLEFVPNEDRVSPKSQACFALTMLVTTARGDAYTWPEYQEMFGNTGFASNAIQRVETEQSVIISTK
jgi:2-polyprenyl-3-methyl-5-hydroxy-6-metoxy-1,4-benzoquinol methylase